jgi:hypothetical protein
MTHAVFLSLVLSVLMICVTGKDAIKPEGDMNSKVIVSIAVLKVR